MNQEGVLACCAVCNQKTHRRCGRCLNIYYCNTEHQRQDWKRHKSECGPKAPKQGSRKDKIGETISIETPKEVDQISNAPEDSEKKVLLKQEGSASETRRLKKSKKKTPKEGSDIISDKQNCQVPTQNSEQTGDTEQKDQIKDSSVISSVVYTSTSKDINKDSAITHEGSSEQEILSESAQLLSAVEFATTSSSNVLRAVNRTDVKMPVIPSYATEHRKEYPEASLKGSGAPFNNVHNNYYLDPNDPCYEICQRVIRDMTTYGVCVLDNFLGKERGQLVLTEVLEMYRSGIFQVR